MSDYVEGNETGTKFKQRRIFTLPEGAEFVKFDAAKMQQIEIIPFINKQGKKQVFFYYDLHKGVGNYKAAVSCLKQFGKNCPVCEAQEGILNGQKYADSADDVKKAFKNMYPKKRVAVNVLINGKMYILDSSTFQFSEPLTRAAAAFKEIKGLKEFLYFSPEVGKTVWFQTVKKTNPFKEDSFYFDFENFSFQDRDKPVSAEWIEKATQLDSCLVEETYETVEAIVYGGTVEEQESTPTQEAPKQASKPVEQPKELTCYAGGTFGKDFDNFKKCDKCPVFTECRGASAPASAPTTTQDYEDDIPF